ncbi:AAA-ATPase-like protein [Thiorhodococcus drewsii AZ1]|uniref:AAA-ATPase-like protein n=1 Tax=Thiorhodococcus drewsii AZ1 TaxID=765913 RepID=G2DWP8_9GAMM|nr:AAA-ATPase-like protein [Thiorhodococcus drewsii AZ1]
MKKLPIGIQTLCEIIKEGYTYVDKTAHALALASCGKYYFLSRPRIFGKIACSTSLR